MIGDILIRDISEMIGIPFSYKGMVIRVTVETMEILLKNDCHYNLELKAYFTSRDFGHLGCISRYNSKGFSWFTYVLDRKVSGVVLFRDLLPYEEMKGGANGNK